MAQSRVFHGISDCQVLRPGSKFHIGGHYRDDWNEMNFLLTKIVTTGTQRGLFNLLPDALEVSFTPAQRIVGYAVTPHRPHGVEIQLGLDERDLRTGELRTFTEAAVSQVPRPETVVLVPGHGGKDRGAQLGEDWEAILRRKDSFRQSVDADWFIHHDADEIMHSSRPGETLLEAIARIDREGYNAIDFDEFVFVHENDSVDYEGQNYYEKMS